MLEKLRSLGETKRYQRSRKDNSARRRLLIGLIACTAVIMALQCWPFFHKA
jgi:hypothetical protein